MRVLTSLTEQLLPENSARRLFSGKPGKLKNSATLTHLVTVAAKNWHYGRTAASTPQAISQADFSQKLNSSPAIGIEYTERESGTPFYTVFLLPSQEVLLFTAPPVE